MVAPVGEVCGRRTSVHIVRLGHGTDLRGLWKTYRCSYCEVGSWYRLERFVEDVQVFILTHGTSWRGLWKTYRCSQVGSWYGWKRFVEDIQVFTL